MPFKKDPRIPTRTPEQIEEEKRFREEFHKNPPTQEAKDAIRTQDLRESLRLVGALKKAYEAQGLTLGQLAERSRMDEADLSRLFAFRLLNPTLSILFRVAAALGLDLSFALSPSDAEQAVDPKPEQAPSGS